MAETDHHAGSHRAGTPPEEVLSTMTLDGTRRWLYPKIAKENFYFKRRTLAWFLIALYVVVPFIKINGKPLLLLDVVGKEFVVFGKSFFATDALLFLLFLLSIGICIIAATAILGRVWCGWACPQTVYLEFVFRPIETLIEGSPNKRRKRDLEASSFEKIWKKTLKYIIYFFISSVLANAFLAYFIGSDTLLHWMTLPPLENPVPFGIMLFVTFLVVFDFAYFREQMCTIACPYARLQSVLLDKNSLIVGYDERRGEPRGKGKDRSEKGDCIDCYQCVEVCPTGIDIRSGLQMECLHCTQCIDACNAVMRKIGQAPDLIKYGSSAQFKGEQSGDSGFRIIRPRSVLYFLALLILTGSFFFRLLTREDTMVQILRDAKEPYRVLETGEIMNHIRIKLTNGGESGDVYSLSVEKNESLRVVIPLEQVNISPKSSQMVSILLYFPLEFPESEVEIKVESQNGFRDSLLYHLKKP